MTKKGKYENPWLATVNGIKQLYGNRNRSVQLPEQIDLSGKKIMITGSSSGLGFAAAKRIAKAGADVIMVTRSGIPEIGERIKQMTGNENISMYHVDLLDFESISKLVCNLEKGKVQIDILISNAAMVPLKSRQSPQGLEEMFMVNYLAPFYLINQLIKKKLLKTKNSKIIIVSSESHRNPKAFDWESFGKYHEYGIKETVSRYGYFKLLLTTFGNELSRRLINGEIKIPIRMLCPGPVNSNIAREAPAWLQPILKAVFSIFFRSPEKASDPIIYFLTEDDSTIPVDYFYLMHPTSMDEKALDQINGQRLWELSERLCRHLGYPLTA
jgi:NAD(P)-dependent dehydrogenase (short-subunit alcohol dehydrogenase family)